MSMARLSPATDPPVLGVAIVDIIVIIIIVIIIIITIIIIIVIIILSRGHNIVHFGEPCDTLVMVISTKPQS